MATYKEIKGVTVQTRDTDPTVNVGSWATGGSLNTARYLAAGTGIQTASIVAGGAGTGLAIAEQYNGTAWSEVGDLTQARYGLGAAGTSTAAVAFAGRHDPSGNKNETEVWDGSSWTEVNNLNTARYNVGQAGHVYTSALCIAGGPPNVAITCLLYTSPSPRDGLLSRMPSSA